MGLLKWLGTTCAAVLTIVIIMSRPEQKNVHTGEPASGTAKAGGQGARAPGNYLRWYVSIWTLCIEKSD